MTPARPFVHLLRVLLSASILLAATVAVVISSPFGEDGTTSGPAPCAAAQASGARFELRLTLTELSSEGGRAEVYIGLVGGGDRGDLLSQFSYWADTFRTAMEKENAWGDTARWLADAESGKTPQLSTAKTAFAAAVLDPSGAELELPKLDSARAFKDNRGRGVHFILEFAFRNPSEEVSLTPFSFVKESSYHDLFSMEWSATCTKGTRMDVDGSVDWSYRLPQSQTVTGSGLDLTITVSDSYLLAPLPLALAALVFLICPIFLILRWDTDSRGRWVPPLLGALTPLFFFVSFIPFSAYLLYVLGIAALAVGGWGAWAGRAARPRLGPRWKAPLTRSVPAERLDWSAKSSAEAGRGRSGGGRSGSYPKGGGPSRMRAPGYGARDALQAVPSSYDRVPAFGARGRDDDGRVDRRPPPRTPGVTAKPVYPGFSHTRFDAEEWARGPSREASAPGLGSALAGPDGDGAEGWFPSTEYEAYPMREEGEESHCPFCGIPVDREWYVCPNCKRTLG